MVAPGIEPVEMWVTGHWLMESSNYCLCDPDFLGEAISCLN